MGVLVVLAFAISSVIGEHVSGTSWDRYNVILDEIGADSETLETSDGGLRETAASIEQARIFMSALMERSDELIEAIIGVFASYAELIAYLRPQWRWIDALQNDFAARADWCVKPYDQANHAPFAVLAHPRDLTAVPGANVKLSAAGSRDPDSNQLSYRWWQYHEADSALAKVTINNAEAQQASFVVPNEPGRQVHIILEVNDNGTPPLVGYQRIVCKIK
jgi:hypothetical protein